MRPSFCVRLGLVALLLFSVAVNADEALPPGAIQCLGLTRFQQGGLVHGVAFSPDGKHLASAGEDAFVRLWDVQTGKQVSESTRHYHGVQSLTYSKDSKRIATVSHGSARILDGATGKQLHQLRMPGLSDAYLGPIFAAAFSPDGKTIATGFDTKEIQLWDVATGKAGLRLQGHTERVSRIVYTTDGKALASASDDGTVRLWCPDTGEILQTLRGQNGRVLALAVSPDGRLLASAGRDGEVLLWEIATSREAARFRPDEGDLFCLAFSPDGKTLASGSARSVRLWDVASHKSLHAMAAKTTSLFGSLSFSPDGKTLAGSDYTSRIYQWDVTTGKDRFPNERPQGKLTALAFSPDGKAILSAGEGEAPRLWDIARGEVSRQFGEPGKYRSVAFAPDGKQVIAVTAGRGFRKWDLAGKEVQKIQRTTPSEALAVLTPDGRYVAWNDLIHMPAQNDWRKFVGVWDVALERELTQVVQPEYQLSALALSNDGRMILSSGNLDRSIGLYETLTGQRQATWQGPDSGISAATFSTDGRVVALGGWDNQVHVRDLATGQNLHRLPQLGTVFGLAMSRDGRLIASAGEGHRAVLVRDLATGKDLARFAGHRGDVRCLAFSPDGQTLASTGDDGLVMIWDVRAAWQKAAPLRLAALPAGELKTLWADLADADASRAYRAAWALLGMQKEAAAFLKENLHTAVLDPNRVKRLLAALDDDDFFVREKAEEDLAALGTLIEDSLKLALKNKPSPEVFMRLVRLVKRLDGKTLTVEEIRARRAIEVLERMGSPESRAVLEVVAKGAAESRITQAAKVALERLDDQRKGS